MKHSLKQYLNSLLIETPPAGLPVYLESLWYDAKGNWDAAHNLIDDLEDATACHVHAYLHRKEGDISNANYWYRKANKTMPSISLKEEWEELVNDLLDK